MRKRRTHDQPSTMPNQSRAGHDGGGGGADAMLFVGAMCVSLMHANTQSHSYIYCSFFLSVGVGVGVYNSVALCWMWVQCSEGC